MNIFSIIIPTWNNLPYLRLCIDSILKHSSIKHQIIVHINEGKDGTKEFLKESAIDCTFSEQNIGICKAVNIAANKAVHNYIVYLNDDMFVLPGWDVALNNAIIEQDSDKFMLSATMIEPKDTSNQCVHIADYGSDVSSFNHEQLLKNYKEIIEPDWSGASWPPVLISRKSWELVGGFSEEFSPGMYSDPDLAMKLWQVGCREFRGVGSSLVYHFMAKSTGKVIKNDGRKQFLKKWGIHASTFYKYYLKIGEPYKGPLQEPLMNAALILHRSRARISRIFL